MRSIFVLLILVMIGLNGKGQSVTALPDSVLSQCCLEVLLLNGNVTTVDWVFVQYITRDGTGTKLFVEYAPNFGGIQWETQIRIQDDFDDVLERSKFIVIPFTVGSTDYGINRNWIANIEENTTTGGTWIYGRFGTPTKRKFSAVEDYETMKNRLLACRPRAIVVAENGLYTEGDTVRMGGFLIEPTTITTEGYNWQMKDTLSSVEFGLDYNTPETLDTTVYWARRSGSVRQMVQLGRRYYYNSMRDTTGGLYSDLTHSWNSSDPFLQYQVFNPSAPTTGTAWFKIQKDNSFLNLSNDATNPYYSLGWAVTNTTASLGAGESGSGDPGNGVVMGAYGFGTTEFLFMKTKAVDAGTATNGQFLQLIDNSSGEVDFATIDPVDSSLYATRYWTGANFFPLQGGTLTGTGGNGFLGLPAQGGTPSTPASGFRMYANGAHNLALRDRNGWITTFDISATANRDFTYPSVGGTFALGTGTTNRVPVWTDANTIISSNIQDNGTAISILSSKPFSFGEWTTAGRPTGANNRWGFNTTNNWIEGYLSAAGAYISPLQSSLTGGAGTAGSVIFLDANGRATQDNANLFWNNSTKRLGIGTTSPSQALEVYTPLTTSVDLAKFQGGVSSFANIKFNINGFQSTISGLLLKIQAIQGTSPYIQQQTELIELGFTTSSANNKVNILAPSFNIAGTFGFLFTSNTSRIYNAFQQSSYISGYDRGLDLNIYDHRTNGTLNKGETLFRLSPSKEVWVGDQSVNTNYNFYVTQPSLGYGAINTTAGSANVTAVGTSTTWTKDFNIGSTLTVNGNSYTVASITNDYAMSFTSTVPTSGQYAYTITGNTDRLGVYKNGGVIITPATGQPRYELTISGTQGVSIPRGTVAQRPTIVASTTPFRYNTDSTALEYGESVGTWRQIATRPYVRSLIAAVPTSNIYTANGSLTADRTLHGAGYTLRFNANTIIRDSLKVANLADHTNPGSIVTTKGGYLGKKKFLMSTDSFVYVRNSGFAISDKYAGWQISGDNHFYVSFADTSGHYRNIAYSKDFDYVGQYGDISIGYVNTRVDKSGQRSAWDMDMSNVVYSTDNLSQIFYADSSGIVKFSYYGAGTKEAADLSKTQSNYMAGFATDGTVLDLERKRDTTIYVVDADYDFSAALTTAQVAARYNRVIFLMTTTAAAGSNSDLTLHTPDINLMQCEYLIRSTDEAGGFTNTIQFGSNNAVQSDNTLTGTYTPAPGQGVGIRAGLRSGVYKYFYY